MGSGVFCTFYSATKTAYSSKVWEKITGYYPYAAGQNYLSFQDKPTTVLIATLYFHTTTTLVLFMEGTSVPWLVHINVYVTALLYTTFNFSGQAFTPLFFYINKLTF